MMKILTTLLIAIVLISCNTKTVVNTETNEAIIQKEKAHLNQVKYTNAIQVYGEPQKSNKKKVTAKNLSVEQLSIIKEYFPNKEYESKKMFFLEALWERPTNAEITVWYLFIENEWKPINVLPTA
ncbi:hypothetical protein [Aureibaculum conchae]|uniref:hypothetical protein n=1 Tax=Aureibaculum sp. 2308TA14-22 TaxID=3108392 RepID=UPI0033915203